MPEFSLNGDLQSYTSLNGLFDPREHLIDCSMVDDTLAYIRLLFTRENIKNNLLFFFTGDDSEEIPWVTRRKKVLTTIVDSLPDEHVYLLAFLYIYTTSSRNESETYYLYGPCGTYRVYWEKLTALEYSDVLTDLAAMTRLKEQFAKIHEVVKRYSTCESPSDVFQSFLSGTPAWTLISGQCGLRSYSVISGGRSNDRVTAHRAKELLSGDGSYYLKVAYHDGGLGVRLIFGATDKNRAPVRRLLEYGANPLDLVQNTFFERPLGSSPFFGVELEFSTDYSVAELIDAQRTLFAIYKNDASITGCKMNRMEMVTLPYTYDELRDEFCAWFKKLDLKNFDTSTTTNNGQHVHIDRRYFKTTAMLRKFVWFITFPGNAIFMQHVSERTPTSMSQWAPSPEYGSMSKGNAFANCIREAEKIRGAVNVSRQRRNTAELRLFKGVVSPATVLKNLEFTLAALDFIAVTSYNDLTVGQFLAWLDSTPTKQYQWLKCFLRALDLEEAKEASTIGNWVFTEKDPNRIQTIIKDKSVSLKNVHVRYLNKMLGRRVFSIKNNELVVDERDKGKISHLDAQVINQYAQ
jgi:hypothetical protein